MEGKDCRRRLSHHVRRGVCRFCDLDLLRIRDQELHRRCEQYPRDNSVWNHHRSGRLLPAHRRKKGEGRRGGIMTGERLFLLYAFPCTDIRLHRGQISAQDKQQLEGLIPERSRPEQAFLARCFPDAFRSLTALARQAGRSVWSLDNVQSYWRDNHGKVGECRVSRVTIQSLEHSGQLVITTDGHFLNVYDIPLSAGSEITTHKSCVIEQL